MKPEFKIVLALLCIIAALFGSYVIGQGAEVGPFSTEITVQNTTNKVIGIQIFYYQSPNSDVIKIQPNSSRNIVVRFGDMFVCTGAERDLRGEKIIDVFKCFFMNVTPEKMYDKDGNKMYWELSE
jgi:hypothetical protein